MKCMTITKTSIFPASKTIIWRKLTSMKTLQYIAYPYATFNPLNCDDNVKWQAGESYEFDFRLFGVIPFGIHKINVINFDIAQNELYTQEYNKHVPVWNHRIHLKKVDKNRTRYTDEVEIYAGWKTPFVCLWAKMFYAHRQKKWIRMLNKAL